MKRRFRLRFLAWLFVPLLPLLPGSGVGRVSVDSFADAPRRATSRDAERPIVARIAGEPDGVPDAFVTVLSGRVVVRAEPDLADHARRLAPLADSMLAQAERRLGAEAGPSVEIRLVSSPSEMAAVAPPGAEPPGWASGIAYADRGVVLLTLTSPRTGHLVPIQAVLRHELVHVVVHRVTRGNDIPTWFDEGISLFEAGDDYAGRSEELLSAALRDHLIPLDRLERGYPSDPALVPLAYAQGLDVVSYLVETYGMGALRATLRKVGEGRTFKEAASDAFGKSVAVLEDEWRRNIRVWYRWIPALLSGATLWGLISGILVWAYLRQRRRRKQIYEAWDREQEAAEDALLAAEPPAAQGKPRGGLRIPPPDGSRSRPRVVYHDGRYHTLH